MRVQREHSRNRGRANRSIRLITCGLVVGSATVVASSAAAQPSALPAAQPAQPASPALSALGGLQVRAAGHPVAPVVKAAAVPAVSPAQRATTDGLLGLHAATTTGRLVAHVRRPAVHPFSMVAVTWKQLPSATGVSVDVRTRHGGVWGGWTGLAADGDGPAAREDSVVRAGTSPLWVGHSTGVEVAVHAGDGRQPSGLEVDTIDPGTSSYDAAVQGALSAGATGGGDLAGTFPGIPPIVTRKQWGADESLGDKCWDPKYGTTFKAVIVHHTAGSNDYTRAEAPALVRGIYAYHTVSRGWCDIGYNFLIDKYGTVYEGRAGGMHLPVRGAHSGDYNVDTTGVSLMGNFDVARPTRPTKHSLVQLVAWRLGTAYHHAYGKPFLYDARFNRISGHRDVMQTACPGRYVYEWLPTLRERVQTRLGDYVSRIEAAWQDAGGAGGSLGTVKVGERGENGGRHTTFAGGRMYASPGGLRTFYHGPILHRYVRTGETGGALGYPTSNVRGVASTHGFTASFAGGRIYWSHPTRSRALTRGAILKRYLLSGGPAGDLGFPVSEIYTVPGGTRARFRGGSISYDASTHKITVKKR